MHRSSFLRHENISRHVESERTNHLLRALHLQSSRCHKSAIIMSIPARVSSYFTLARIHDEEQRGSFRL